MGIQVYTYIARERTREGEQQTQRERNTKLYAFSLFPQTIEISNLARLQCNKEELLKKDAHFR